MHDMITLPTLGPNTRATRRKDNGNKTTQAKGRHLLRDKRKIAKGRLNKQRHSLPTIVGPGISTLIVVIVIVSLLLLMLIHKVIITHPDSPSQVISTHQKKRS